MTEYSEEEIEEMIEKLIEILEENPDEFNAFERTFIESVEEQNEAGHLTTTGQRGGKSQVQVLEEIYDDHLR